MYTPEKEWVIIDNDGMSVQFFLRDLAIEFLGKIVRAYLKGNLDREQTLEFLRVILIPHWTQDYTRDLLSCYILDFAREMHTLSCAYSLEAQDLSSLNLTITLSSFVGELKERIIRDARYRDELYPAWEALTLQAAKNKKKDARLDRFRGEKRMFALESLKDARRFPQKNLPLVTRLLLSEIFCNSRVFGSKMSDSPRGKIFNLGTCCCFMFTHSFPYVSEKKGRACLSLSDFPYIYKTTSLKSCSQDLFSMHKRISASS